MKSKTEELDDLGNEFLEIINSSSVEEREFLAQHFEKRCMKMESEDLKQIMKLMIDYARFGEVLTYEKKN